MVNLDTLQGGVGDSLIFEEDGNSSIDVTNESRDGMSEPSVTLSEDDIESIVQSVKAEEGIAPSVIMVNDQADTEGNVAVRVLSGSQIPGQQDTGPIVVINIHADTLGIGGNEGGIDIRDLVTVRNKGNSARLEVDEPVIKELDMDKIN